MRCCASSADPRGHAGDAYPRRSRDGRLAAEAAPPKRHHGVGRQRRDRRRPLSRARRSRRFRRALARGARDARAYPWLRELRAGRREHGVHRRLPSDPRQRPHRFPGGRRAHDVSLGEEPDPGAAAVVPSVSGARLPRAHCDQRRRRARVQSAPGRRHRRRRFRRLHDEPRVAASQANGHRGARELKCGRARNRASAARPTRSGRP